MSVFVCPLGVYYDDEGCILCDLCIATTKEEMTKATAKMGRYLRAQERKRQAISEKQASVLEETKEPKPPDDAAD